MIACIPDTYLVFVAAKAFLVQQRIVILLKFLPYVRSSFPAKLDNVQLSVFLNKIHKVVYYLTDNLLVGVYSYI